MENKRGKGKIFARKREKYTTLMERKINKFPNYWDGMIELHYIYIILIRL